MNSLKVLDVTLRDGGCVNNFNFGQPYMDKILSALEQSCVECIEMGYIDDKNGTEQGRTQYCNEQVISQYFLKDKKPGKTYVVMMDYGKFNPNDLQPRTAKSIDGIRLAFHKNNRKDIVAIGRTIMEKGYQFFIQPMLTLRYSDAELLELIGSVNKDLPDASGFYIVDSFGEMRPNDMSRVLNLVDHNLSPDMTIGFHSHNNLQMSYSNAISLLQFPTNRNMMLDCSVMGMGKGAGNLSTELLLEHLNLYYGKNYNIAPLLEVMDTVLNPIKAEFYWGYSVEYYLSSINSCTPSYAGHFYNKHMLSIDQVAELLGMIADEKKVSFDKNYAEELYRQYNTSKFYNDIASINRLRNQFVGKKILVIAPGKSIIAAHDDINEILNAEDVVSISLNNFAFSTDFIMTTRKEAYEKAVNEGRQIIVPSNISRDGHKNVNVIDYKKWIYIDENTHDSSGVVILKILKELGICEVMLAGFDGFSVDINANYYDKSLRNTVTEEEANSRNDFFKRYIAELRKSIAVSFLTESKYY